MLTFALLSIGLCVPGVDALAIDEVSHLLLGGQTAEDIVVVDDYAYVTTESFMELKVIDVSVPTAPFLVSSLVVPGTIVRCLDKGGPYLYVGADDRMYVVDAQDPSNPAIVGEFADPDSLPIFDIAVVDTTAYLFTAGPVRQVSIVDPPNPMLVKSNVFMDISSFPINYDGEIATFYHNNFPEVASPDGYQGPMGLYRLLVSDQWAGHTREYLFDKLDTPATEMIYAPVQDMLYVATQSNVIHAVDNCYMEGCWADSFITAGRPLDLRLSEDSLMLYVAEENQVLEVFDISSTPYTPPLIGNFVYPFDRFNEMSVSGSYAYAAADKMGLVIVSLSTLNITATDQGIFLQEPGYAWEYLTDDIQDGLGEPGASSLTADGQGNLYLLGSTIGGGPDYIWKIAPDGTGSMFAFSGVNPLVKFRGIVIDRFGFMMISATRENEYPIIRVAGFEPLSVPPDTEVPFALHGNQPNPFRSGTTVFYYVPSGGAEVLLEIYDVAGRRVKTLVDQRVPAGERSAEWDGRDERGIEVANGVYIYQIRAGQFADSGRMVLMK